MSSTLGNPLKQEISCNQTKTTLAYFLQAQQAQQAQIKYFLD